jgi:CheY-like chemotaxis protein
MDLDVVVVDDEPDVATYLAAVLERRGFRPHIARSAADGFALVKRLRPDVVCIDVVMPEESGVTLLRRIRDDAEVKDTPVIMVSALRPDAPPLGGPGQDAPVPVTEEYLEKPPSREALIAAVERAAASRRSS